jgi:hypothetical protein
MKNAPVKAQQEVSNPYATSLQTFLRGSDRKPEVSRAVQERPEYRLILFPQPEYGPGLSGHSTLL